MIGEKHKRYKYRYAWDTYYAETEELHPCEKGQMLFNCYGTAETIYYPDELNPDLCETKHYENPEEGGTGLQLDRTPIGKEAFERCYNTEPKEGALCIYGIFFDRSAFLINYRPHFEDHFKWVDIERDLIEKWREKLEKIKNE